MAATEEARELMAAGGGDPERLGAMLDRRTQGEPLAWITGRTTFGTLDVRVDAGVYVPRWQSLELARRAAARLPTDGHAIDLCTGSGALAKWLVRARPRARVVATDTHPLAVACARSNGVEAYLGSLFDAVPTGLEGATDVVVAVVPYVPSDALALLPSDTLHYEERSSYDGGVDGTDLLRQVVETAPRYLRRGGTLLLELGGDQDQLLAPRFERLGYAAMETWTDQDGEVRGVEARRP